MNAGGMTMQHKLMSQLVLAGTGALLMIWSLAADAQDGPPPAPVKVVAAESLNMASTVLAPGTVVSLHDASIAAEIAGSLKSVAEVGDEVQAGDVIAAINDDDLQLQLQFADATIKRLEASLKYSNRQLDRQKKLASQNIAARNELDETESQRDMAEQELIQAKVSRKQIVLLIEKSRIRAPFGGRIVARFRDAGEYLSVGSEVVRLVDTNNIEIQAQAPITVARFLDEGTDVVIRDRDRSVISQVRAVIPVGDQRSRMIEVRIRLNEENWVIGSAVRVALPEAHPVQVVAVPRDALILRQNSTYLFKVNVDDTVEQVTVTTGIGSGSLIEVSGDVHDGDRVVVRGGETLRAGQSVMIASDKDEKTVTETLQLAKRG
ncbi:MAG: efflux RND transporter periplasmic adaptor subunit [Gammaproteobacteria bacterium]